ncbi:hypothetical protein QUF70_07035 [Desulfobacterales bacterium HSG17]|nr:hypothetical protein [Desulfobacterales bacterium HSG17]
MNKEKKPTDKLSSDDKTLIADAIEQRAIEQARKTSFLKVAKFAGDSLFVIFAFIPFILLIFMILYIIKSALGIDIFPEKHLWDIILPG